MFCTLTRATKIGDFALPYWHIIAQFYTQILMPLVVGSWVWPCCREMCIGLKYTNFKKKCAIIINISYWSSGCKGGGTLNLIKINLRGRFGWQDWKRNGTSDFCGLGAVTIFSYQRNEELKSQSTWTKTLKAAVIWVDLTCLLFFPPLFHGDVNAFIISKRKSLAGKTSFLEITKLSTKEI